MSCSLPVGVCYSGQWRNGSFGRAAIQRKAVSIFIDALKAIDPIKVFESC
jgi:hypothetical protein